jgi:hypothetical protein
MKDEYQKPLFVLLAVLIGLAGFIAADRFLFGGSITPDPLKAVAGWIVCPAVGIYLATLFWKQNKA